MLKLFLEYFSAWVMVTNCTDERSISQLNHIKNDLRITMSQERLRFNSISLLCIECDQLREIKFDDNIADYAMQKLIPIPNQNYFWYKLLGFGITFNCPHTWTSWISEPEGWMIQYNDDEWQVRIINNPIPSTVRYVIMDDLYNSTAVGWCDFPGYPGSKSDTG